MKRYQVLEKAVKLIDEPSAWCRHTGARDKDGNSVDPLDENAVSFCVIGAVQRVLGEKGKDQSLSGDLNAVLGLLPGESCLSTTP